MKSLKLLLILGISFSLFAACEQSDMQSDTSEMNETELSSDVITAEDQEALTPDGIIQQMKDGNERFVNNNLTARDHQAQVQATSDGQYPAAIVISCVDSRVPVEDIFDMGIGDVFVARVAGNFVNEDILGSAEFATAAAGSKVVVVMGHESCGAVKSAIDGVEMGNITAMLDKIEPAIEMTENYEGEQTSANDEYVTEVVNNNVRHTISEIRERSSIIADLERNGELVIAGAFYDLDTGEVTFLEP